MKASWMQIWPAGLAIALFMTPVSALAQDAAAGANVFTRCQVCHSVDPSKIGGIGPNLAGVIGRKAGSEPKFIYSKSMAAANFKWDYAKIEAYLTNPQAVVPGNKMAFGGISNAKDRRDLIAYLAAHKKP